MEWRCCRGVWVSNRGTIWGRAVNREITPLPKADGYCRVWVNGKKVTVHELIAEAFLGERPPGMTVDHKNRIRHDNRVSNLQYATKEAQIANRVCPKNTVLSTPIEVCIGDGEWLTYPSIAEACRKNGFKISAVVRVLKGKLKTHHGARFRRLPEDVVEDNGVEEEWRLVDNFYVSSLGRIKNDKGRVWTPNPSPVNGYCSAYGKRVHVLVCTAFHGPRPSAEATVDHINRIKHDNRASNLRWATKSEQMSNRKLSFNNVNNIKAVRSIDNLNAITEYESTSQASLCTGISCNSICWSIRTGHKAGGMRWERV